MLTTVILLSPLALIAIIGGPVVSPLIASGTVLLGYLAQRQIAKRLFSGPPASAALIRVARDRLPLPCHASFDGEVAGEIDRARVPISAWRVVELHRSVRRAWRHSLDSDAVFDEQHLAVQISELHD